MGLFNNIFGTGINNMPVIARVLVGESLVIEDGDQTTYLTLTYLWAHVAQQQKMLSAAL